MATNRSGDPTPHHRDPSAHGWCPTLAHYEDHLTDALGAIEELLAAGGQLVEQGPVLSDDADQDSVADAVWRTTVADWQRVRRAVLGWADTELGRTYRAARSVFRGRG